MRIAGAEQSADQHIEGARFGLHAEQRRDTADIIAKGIERLRAAAPNERVEPLLYFFGR